MRVIAISDIHGCIEAFTQLLDKVALTHKDRLLILGDSIDRGPNSKAVLDKIMDITDKGYNIDYLMGNHEEMLLNSLENKYNFSIWLLSGGRNTLKSFGCKNSKEIPVKYINFIAKTSYYQEIDNNLFVHAGFNEDAADPFSDENAMLWTRKNTYNTELFKSKTIIHGHTPCAINDLKLAIENNEQAISIDTGCAWDREDLGHLSAFDVTNRILYHVKKL